MKFIKLLFPLCFILVACTQPAPKQTLISYDDGGGADRFSNSSSKDSSKEFPDKNPDGRVTALKALAEKDARAAYDLGLRFFRGDGIPQDSYQALVWMRKAAEGGDLEAQKALGRLYLTGLEEMGSDPQEAEKWLTLAASRGDKESEKLLAEAQAAAKSDTTYRHWRNHWRNTFFGYWNSGYPYRSYWRQGLWYFY